MANSQSLFIRVGNGEERELKLRYISPRDARLVSKFMASHGAEITLAANMDSIADLRCWAYTFLADILFLLKNHSVLDILDNQRSSLFQMVGTLRSLRFAGSWVDSLEILFVNKAEYDSCHMKKLVNLERRLMLRYKILRAQMKLFACEPKKLSRFRQRIRLVKSELANVIGKKKTVSNARKSLNFFYPIY
jgi:hypothetical protein